jgi:hypothetical protein
MRKSGLTTVFALALVAAGCGGGGGGGGETYIRFETDGRAFSVDDAELLVQEIEDEPGRYFVSLRGALGKPNASAHFHIFLDSAEAIANQTVEYSRLPDDMFIPLVAFELGGDLSVAPTSDYSFTIYFRDIQDGIIAGTFSGQGFSTLDLGSDEMRPTAVSGTFRARVVAQ